MFTRFMDMHSGGGTKVPPYEYIYIEAPEVEAKVVFYSRFGQHPSNVTCSCCGEDYSIESEEDFEKCSAYDRGCKWTVDGYDLSTARTSISEYEERHDVLVIRSGEIQDSERIKDLPQADVWGWDD